MKTNKTYPEDYKIYFRNGKYNLEFVEGRDTVFASVEAPKAPPGIVNEILKYIRGETRVCIFNPHYSKTHHGILVLNKKRNKVKLYEVELDYKNNNHEYSLYDKPVPTQYKYQQISPFIRNCKSLVQAYDFIKERKVSLNYREIDLAFSCVSDAINDLLYTEGMIDTGYYANDSLGKVFFAAFSNMVYDFLYNHVDIKRLFKALITSKVKPSIHTYKFDVWIAAQYNNDEEKDTLLYTSLDDSTVEVLFLFDYSESILYIYPYHIIDDTLFDFDFSNAPFKGDFKHVWFAEPYALPIMPSALYDKLELSIPK